MDSGVDQRGLRELLTNLDGLNVAVASSAAGACLAIAGEVKRKAIENARAQGLVATGALVNNIAVKRQRDGVPPNQVEYHVGVRHGPEAKGGQKIAVRGADGRVHMEYVDDPFYWFFWEFGHYNVFLRRFLPAKPFMRPAVESTAPKAIDIAAAYLSKRLERVTSKAVS